MKAKLWITLLMLAATAGCSDVHVAASQVSAEAQTPAAVQARADAVAQAKAFFEGLPIETVAGRHSDICTGGEKDPWYTDEYRVTCHRDETRYIAVDGDLLKQLRRLDAAVKAQEGGGDPSPMEYVEYYFAHKGKSSDGLQLSKPSLGYTTKAGSLSVDWPDPAFPEPSGPAAPFTCGPDLGYCDRGGQIPDEWIRSHKMVLTLYLGNSYYKAPW